MSNEGRSPIDIELSRAAAHDDLARLYQRHLRLNPGDINRLYGSREELQQKLVRHQHERDAAFKRAEELEKEFGLAGLGYTTEAHAVQSSDQMRLAYGTAADLESSLKKGNCETAFSDLLRLTEWGTGAALNAQAAGSGEGEVTQRMTELQRNAAAAFKKKCLIKRRR